MSAGIEAPEEMQIGPVILKKDMVVVSTVPSKEGDIRVRAAAVFYLPPGLLSHRTPMIAKIFVNFFVGCLGLYAAFISTFRASSQVLLPPDKAQSFGQITKGCMETVVTILSQICELTNSLRSTAGRLYNRVTLAQAFFGQMVVKVHSSAEDVTCFDARDALYPIIPVDEWYDISTGDWDVESC